MKFEQSEIMRKANEGLVQQRKGLDGEIFSLEQDKKSAENDLRMAEMDLKHANMGVERHTAEIKKAQEDWKTYSEREYPEENLEKIKAEQFDETSLVCPTCGQDLPVEQAEKIRSEFERKKTVRIKNEEDIREQFYQQKDKKLIEITESGNKAATDLKESKKAQEEAERKISELKQKITSLAMEIQQKQAELSKLPESVDLSDNAEYQKITAEIEQKETALRKMENVSEQRKEITDKRNGFIRECAKVDAEINNIQRKKQEHEEEVEKLYQAFRESSQKEADIQRKKDILKNFSIKKNERIAEMINPYFEEFQFNFLSYTQNNDPVEVCEMLRKGVEYRNLNYSDQLICKVDLLCGFQKIQGVSLPIFIDNAESINVSRRPVTNRQMVFLEVTEGSLKVEEV